MKEFNTKNICKVHTAYVEASRSLKNANEWNRERLKNQCDEAKAKFGDEAAKLNEIIAAAQGKAKERLIDAVAVCEALEDINNKLSIAKKSMEGIVASVDINAQNFKSAYKYRAQSTRFTAVFRCGSWRITSIERCDCRHENEKFALTLTDAAKQAIIENHTYFN